jgi:hypothetical protein
LVVLGLVKAISTESVRQALKKTRMANLTELAAGGVRRTGRRVDEEG